MPLKSLFAYSFQSFYLAGSFLLLFIFLPSFYNLSVGFALSTIGMIILISRVFDVFSDFFIGYFTEKRFIKGLPKKNQILLGIFIPSTTFCSSSTQLTTIEPHFRDNHRKNAGTPIFRLLTFQLKTKTEMLYFSFCLPI